MMKKSTSSPTQSGASMAEVMIGIFAAALLLAVTVFFVQSVRESKRVERTLLAVHALKEQVRKVNRNQGSYTQGRMLPILFAAKAFPETLNVDYEKRQVSTPMGHPLDVTGRGRYFSIDLYSLTPDDCYDIGAQIVAGNYFMLGNTSDDLEVIKIGQMDFDDRTPLTLGALENACTQSFSIDLIMAFR